MLDFVTRTADLGTTEPLPRKERTYHGQNVTNMRRDIVERAKATIAALTTHKGRTLRAPMARSVRNGIAVKVGYGKSNVGFYVGKGEDRVALVPERRFAHDRKSQAIEYLRQLVAALEAGEFDGLLSEKLADMVARFSARAGTNEQEEDATNAVAALYWEAHAKAA